MMRRPWWLLGVLVLGAACSSSSTCDPSSPLVYVDLPAGTEGVSFAATGACGAIAGGCVPLLSSCQTAGCACRITLQVNPSTFDASPDGVCHIEVVSASGVFSKDLAFMSKGGSCFDVSGPVGTIVVASPAPTVDGGGDADASGADADASGADAGASDADAAPGDGG
ncbi:MAG TPA: hypothetical protein VHL80_12190 [Polyangia bacterium]|nr:hypothetical protein [Polyangia bacterium]